MAVENKVVNHNALSGKVDESADSIGTLFFGGAVKKVPFSFEVAAADDDGSVYRVARIPVTARNIIVRHGSDDITAGTDYDIGFYKPKSLGGAAIDADAIADGLDYSGADALAEIRQAGADFGKLAWEYAGLSALPVDGYMDIAFTANTVGSAAGTIYGEVEFIGE